MDMLAPKKLMVLMNFSALYGKVYMNCGKELDSNSDSGCIYAVVVRISDLKVHSKIPVPLYYKDFFINCG